MDVASHYLLGVIVVVNPFTHAVFTVHFPFTNKVSFWCKVLYISDIIILIKRLNNRWFIFTIFAVEFKIAYFLTMFEFAFITNLVCIRVVFFPNSVSLTICICLINIILSNCIRANKNSEEKNNNEIFHIKLKFLSIVNAK